MFSARCRGHDDKKVKFGDCLKTENVEGVRP